MKHDETRQGYAKPKSLKMHVQGKKVCQANIDGNFLFFFAEMVEDWTVNYKPDLLTFVPYEWSFNIILRDFEMVWLGNQHNWIESNSNKQENGVLDSCVFFNERFVLKMCCYCSSNNVV